MAATVRMAFRLQGSGIGFQAVKPETTGKKLTRRKEDMSSTAEM